MASGRHRALPIFLPQEWAVHAACKHVEDPNIFWPVDAKWERDGDARITDLNQLRITRALELCEACPVRLECLEWALRAKEKSGVWGGKTAQERANILTQQRRVR